MKKIAIAIVLLTGIASAVSAQDYGPKLRLGVSGSPSFAWFAPRGSAAESAGSRFGFNYGLNADFRLGMNANYYFSTGLFMMNNGGTIDYKTDYANRGVAELSTEYRLGYVNIPVLLKLRSNEIGYSTYFARVGFDGGVKIRAIGDRKWHFEGNNETIANDEVDLSDQTTLFRVGLHIEGGMEYNLGGTTNILVSIEWNNGLTNVFTKEVKPYIANNNGVLVVGDRLNAVTNFLALNVGVYF